MFGGAMSAGALARRAVVCKHWRWMPGMLSAGPCGGRVWGVTYTFPEDDAVFGPWLWLDNEHHNGRAAPGHLPDLTDPATLGALLGLVRGAYGDQEAFVRPDGSGSWVFCTLDPMAPRVVAPNEAWCLVAALEAAP
jgi:hypothetical protein